MKTKILKPSLMAYLLAGKLIRKGEIVAFPTETVYGLGASSQDSGAVEKIYKAKGRPQDNPLIVHLDTPKKIKKYVKNINEIQQKLINAFMPGPISIIFDRNDKICDRVCANGPTVAIRVPENIVARRFIHFAKRPICAPSANTSKRPSPTIAKHVYDDMNGKIPLIIDGGATTVGIESTVVKVDNNKIYILRPGKISKSDLEKATGLEVVEKLTATLIPESPGTKYTHYKPKCDMVIVKTNSTKKICEIYDDMLSQSKSPIIFCCEDNKNKYDDRKVVVVGKDSNEASVHIFTYLRDCENNDLIISEFFDKGTMVEALFNRMSKSASGNIIE